MRRSGRYARGVDIVRHSPLSQPSGSKRGAVVVSLTFPSEDARPPSTLLTRSPGTHPRENATGLDHVTLRFPSDRLDEELDFYVEALDFPTGFDDPRAAIGTDPGLFPVHLEEMSPLRQPDRTVRFDGASLQTPRGKDRRKPGDTRTPTARRSGADSKRGDARRLARTLLTTSPIRSATQPNSWRSETGNGSVHPWCGFHPKITPRSSKAESTFVTQ